MLGTGSPTLATESIDEPLEAIIERAREKSKAVYGQGHAIMSDGKVLTLQPHRSGLSKKHQGKTFDNFSGNDRLVSDLKALSVGPESVLLSGSTGCGKTHLAVAMMQECQASQQVFTTVPELLLEIRSAFNGGRESEAEIIRRYSVAPLLVLDDLGAEQDTAYAITTLYLIIDRRNREDRKTIITTNLKMEEIEAAMGARIASRLSEMRIIGIGMPDYRKRR